MKLITYKYNSNIHIGYISNNDQVTEILNPDNGNSFNSMIELLINSNYLQIINDTDQQPTLTVDDVQLLAPIHNPPSMRDAYAFRQHVESARRNRGVEMIPEYDEIPIFYFTNHNAVTGPGNVHVLDDHLNKLDFELEIAAIIGKKGRNISAKDADSFIAGYTIMNDWSARALQMHEMKLNLGPAKGKDFATSIGPYLMTLDDLESCKIPSDDGDRYDIELTCHVNGKQISQDNFKNMSWTFAQIIERASYGVDLYPGDVIGSGTCGTGCFLELNGTYPDRVQWLQNGDVVEIKAGVLGVLINKIIKNNY